MSTFHISVPTDDAVEIVESTQISPLVSKCQVKVLYVGDNRNHTNIEKPVAYEMGRKLLGSPIVGLYDFETEDFVEHSREISIKDGKFSVIDLTKPYGFVGTDAQVWFQRFKDDDNVIREYLMTEAYIWTDIYPESKRIVEKGNNQSMELNKKSLKGNWTKNENSGKEFFIINEAVIEKLCILGEDYEPCFEGAQIASNFALDEQLGDLKAKIIEMVKSLKGGTQTYMAEPELEFKEEEKEEKEIPPVEENQPEEEDEKKKEYSLEEIPEYVELNDKYNLLSTDFEALKAEKESLEAEVQSLREFKLGIEKDKKQTMIDSFTMLSEQDKADVIEHIDTYSLDDIEAKLSVICVRNKVNFSLDNEEEKEPEVTYNLQDIQNHEDDAPEWVKAVRQFENK